MSAFKIGDELNTQNQIKKLRPPQDGINWLRHQVGQGTANIDDLLLKGATMSELKNAGRGAVNEHLHHLQKEHRLTIIEEDGKYRFADKQLKPK